MSASIGELTSASELILVDVSAGNQIVSPPARLMFVGGAGDVYVRASNDASFVKIVSGDFQYHPIRVAEIRQTGTTATDMVLMR